MEEKLVEFETAVLAYDKGLKSKYIAGEGYIRPIAPTTNAYNFNTRKLIINEGNYFTTGEHDHTRDYTVILAPTQSLLSKWIREVHEIHIEIRNYIEYKYKIIYLTPTFNKRGTQILSVAGSKYYNNYEDCMEQALIESLTLIKI